MTDDIWTAYNRRSARIRRAANLDRIAGWIGYAVVILFTAWIAVEITESVRRIAWPCQQGEC
jgi:hypothetical protein